MAKKTRKPPASSGKAGSKVRVKPELVKAAETPPAGERRVVIKGLPKAELKEFKTLLQARSNLLLGDLDGLEGETRGKAGDTAGDQSSVPGHMAELASDASEKALSFGRMQSQSDELKDIQDAFERIKDGSYGSCEKCQGKIPKERLRAIPYAPLCVKCQTKAERE